jgi:hypothetical protein
MHFIEWRPTREHKVEVLNDTSDVYRCQALPAMNGNSEAVSILAPLLRATDKPRL